MSLIGVRHCPAPEVASIAISSDGQTLAWAGESGAGHIVRLSDGATSVCPIAFDRIWCTSIANKTNTVAFGCHAGVVLWDGIPGELGLAKTVPLGLAIAVVCAFNPSGSRLACGLDQLAVIVIDPEQALTVLALRECPTAAIAIEWSPDGQRLAAALGGGGLAYISIWSAVADQTLSEVQQPAAKAPTKSR